MASNAASERATISALRGWLEAADRLGELKRISGTYWDVGMGDLPAKSPKLFH